MALHIPDREICEQVAIAPNPLRWTWWPRFNRKPPQGQRFRGGWQLTWLFLDYQRWWRYA